MSSVEASLLFLSSAKNNFDTYANYTVYLCAETLGVLFGSGSKTPHPYAPCQSATDEEGSSYVHRWQEVFSHAELWHENRPNQMKPVFTVPVATPDYPEGNRPFPTVLYGNGDASKYQPWICLILTNTTQSLEINYITSALCCCSNEDPRL